MFQKSYMFEHTHRFSILQRKIHSEELESVVILVSFVKFVSSCIFSVKLKLWQTVNTKVRLLYSAIFNDSASFANLRTDKTPISTERPPPNLTTSYPLGCLWGIVNAKLHQTPPNVFSWQAHAPLSLPRAQLIRQHWPKCWTKKRMFTISYIADIQCCQHVD